MNTSRPLIGVTAFESQYIKPPHTTIHGLGRAYVHAIETEGGAPLIIPPSLSEASLRRVFDALDGLVLSGGNDVDPALYGEAPHPLTQGINGERDRAEIALVRWAVGEDKPLFCICRGLQVLNVALGGSLVQDIPSQVPDALIHHPDGAAVPRDHLAHPVGIERDSILGRLVGGTTLSVNSWHHQAIRRPASGLMVVAYSPDGIIEAVEIPGHAFGIGVQWHPEWMVDARPDMRRFFSALVASSRG